MSPQIGEIIEAASGSHARRWDGSQWVPVVWENGEWVATPFAKFLADSHDKMNARLRFGAAHRKIGFWVGLIIAIIALGSLWSVIRPIPAMLVALVMWVVAAFGLGALLNLWTFRRNRL